jgi:hypothetical protein
LRLDQSVFLLYNGCINSENGWGRIYSFRPFFASMKAKNQKTIKILLLGTLIFGMGGFLLSFEPVFAATGINKEINFQGKVVNTDGTNVSNGSYNFLFCIYTTASPTTACTSGADNDAVWRESKSITVTDGIFQSNLGDTTALPGSVDFNTDNIYLGVNFNSNGQMTPLVRFTAAPYAMNADKVHGLTVTDTTGTLTIATGKTLTASNTLTFQGTDGSTLNVGTGGTLGTAAYTASTAYLASGDSAQNGYFGNVYLDDTDASHHLILDEGSNLTADRILSILTGDAARTLTLSGNLNVSADATLSGTNTGDQNLFQTFAVSGQSNVVADSTTDTVTLIAGTNITITTNATNDEITINSSGGSGPFTDGSGITYLTDTAEDLAAGGSVLDSPFSVDVSLAKLNLGASASFDPITITPTAKGTTSYSGNITSADLTSANRTWTFPDETGTVCTTGSICSGYQASGSYANTALSNLASVAINTSLISDTNNTDDLGSDTIRWKDLYLGPNTLHIGTSATDEGTLSYNTTSNIFNISTDSTSNGDIAFFTDDLYLDKSTGRVGIGTTAPANMLDIFGTANMLRLSYDASNYATLASDNTGNLVVNNSSAAQNVVLIGDGSATDSSVQFDGNVNDYYIGQDDTDDFLHIGTGSVVGTNAYITLDSTGNIGIGDATPDAKLDVDSVQTSGTLFGVLDSTAITGAIIGQSITLSGTGAFDQTGLEFNLSGASGTNLNDIVGSGSTWKVSKGGAATFSSVASSDAIAANGGITFDQSADTVGSFTAGGTILMNSNILQDIGNTGTDFIASTGALTLAGVLTANGGISLSGSQSLSAAALSFVDLGSITHSTTANQGLRLPNAASATPSNPTSGEGYLAWDAAGNQLIAYNGSAWTTVGGGAQTPWASDISAAGYDLGSLSNLGFQETTGAPTGTDVGFYRDNTGDLTGNVLTGKTFNLAVNGADEYNFSSTGLAFNSNDITGLGANLTAAGALTIASGTAAALTINSGTTGTINIGTDASAETISIGTGAGAKAVTLGSTNTTSGTTINSGSGGITMVANGTTISNAELILLDGKTGTLIDDTDLTSGDGAGGTSSGSGMEAGTGGIGLLQGCSDGQVLKWTESTSVWACAADASGSGGVPNMYSFEDTTSDTMADNNTTDYWDGTQPNLTPSASTSEILVMATINVDSSSTSDQHAAVRLFRNIGAAATCSSTQINGIFGALGSDATEKTISFIVVDAPATTSNVTYTICASADQVGTSQTIPRMYVTLYEINNNADLAEVYPTNDTTLAPGELVVLDPTLQNGVRRADKGYDKNVIGVVSTKPALVIGGRGGEGVTGAPIALSGRVPVKVSDENGPIKKGDALTLSSIAGVAMRATKAGPTVGIAMNDFADSGTGTVMMFVKIGYFNGINLNNLLPKVGDTGANIDADNSASLLKYFIGQKETAGMADLSEIFTDRIAAGLEIVTPKVMAETVALDKIEAATGLDINMNLADGGAFKINNSLTGENSITFDNAGNATLQGTLTADAIVANKILGLEIFTNQISNVDESVADLSLKLENLNKKAEEIPDLSSLGIAEKKGGLVIAKKTILKEAAIFEKLVTLLGNVIFRGNVSFEKVPTFNKDMAGYAIIKEGGDKVKVNFEEEYVEAPIINASLSLQYIEDDEVREAAEELLLITDVKYIITNVTTKGFEIRIGQQAGSDIPFAWIALAVKDAKTFASKSAASNKNDDEQDSAVSISESDEENSPVQMNNEAVVIAPVADVATSENTAVGPTEAIPSEVASGAETVSEADPPTSETDNVSESNVN